MTEEEVWAAAGLWGTLTPPTRSPQDWGLSPGTGMSRRSMGVGGRNMEGGVEGLGRRCSYGKDQHPPGQLTVPECAWREAYLGVWGGKGWEGGRLQGASSC